MPPAAARASRHRLALVADPRFPGGTSAAVAAEIRALAGSVVLSLVALETRMFKGRTLHPAIAAACDEHGVPVAWNPTVVHADTVAFHNPSCLRFDDALRVRLSCARAFVVTHENFLRPGGGEGFDVEGCLGMVDAALVCGERRLAPISRHNRRTVAAWCTARGADWRLAPFDWTDVLDLALAPPTAAPRDRRGRHSRPGLEKFPARDVLLAHFPPSAERCVILGGDRLLEDPAGTPAHWDVRRFAPDAVPGLLRDIDFFVYFTNPLWRESFGRAIAEAIAAGKVVITDPGTAESFGSAVVASDGSDVDAIIGGFVAEPERYGAFVRAAQAELARFSPERFRAAVLPELLREEAPHALV